MRLIDSHAHLWYDRFENDRPQMIDRARAGGVVAFVTVATDATTTNACFALAETATDVFPTAGVHPNDAGRATGDDWRVIETRAAEARCVAIGETGMDFYRDDTAHDVQRAAFARQVALAQRVDKPVIIHCREAFDSTYEIVAQAAAAGPVRGVMHCFSGGVPEAERAVALGLHISFAGPVTYKKNDALRATLRAIPRDRILIETDCPFLPPEGRRGQRNEPAFLPAIVATIASTLGSSPDDIAELTTRNAISLFRLKL